MHAATDTAARATSHAASHAEMDAGGGHDIERRLVELARSTGPLRAALARLACWLVACRAWETVGYARLSDYADECIGLSARSIHDLARVGHAFYRLPRLREALVDGRLCWTKTRLVARVAKPEDEERWIEYARGVTALALSREVRKLDRGSVEGDALEDERDRSRGFEVTCTPEVRARWAFAQSVARRVHGGRLTLSGCAEQIAAEVLSALPMDPDSAEEEAQCDPGAPGTSWEEARPHRDDPLGPDALLGGTAVKVPAAIEALLEGAESADALEIDRRMRRAVAMEQRLDSRIGPLLEVVLTHRLYRRLPLLSLSL